MDIEYEATFPNIDKDEIRQRLKKAGAELMKPEFTQRRVVFSLPKGNEIKGGWLRVRDEGDRITLVLKIIDGKNIDDQREIGLEVNDFNQAIDLLQILGCKKMSYQESKREIWRLDKVEIMIDEWPYLEPFVEVEGKNEEVVKEVSQKLGFDYKRAVFENVSVLYEKKYGRTLSFDKGDIPDVTFSDPNPFI